MKIELDTFTQDWPKCYYDPDHYCGEREVDGRSGYYQSGFNPRFWHVGAFCDCPSCPIRCAVRDTLYKYKKES